MSASFSKGGAGKVNVHFNAWIKINISTHKIWSIFDPCLHYLVSCTLITPKYLELLKIWSQPIPERKLISADYALKKTDWLLTKARQTGAVVSFQQAWLWEFDNVLCEDVTNCSLMFTLNESLLTLDNMKELPIKSFPSNNNQILIKQTH